MAYMDRYQSIIYDIYIITKTQSDKIKDIYPKIKMIGAQQHDNCL